MLNREHIYMQQIQEIHQIQFKDIKIDINLNEIPNIDKLETLQNQEQNELIILDQITYQDFILCTFTLGQRNPGYPINQAIYLGIDQKYLDKYMYLVENPTQNQIEYVINQWHIRNQDIINTAYMFKNENLKNMMTLKENYNLNTKYIDLTQTYIQQQREHKDFFYYKDIGPHAQNAHYYIDEEFYINCIQWIVDQCQKRHLSSEMLQLMTDNGEAEYFSDRKFIQKLIIQTDSEYIGLEYLVNSNLTHLIIVGENESTCVQSSDVWQNSDLLLQIPHLETEYPDIIRGNIEPSSLRELNIEILNKYNFDDEILDNLFETLLLTMNLTHFKITKETISLDQMNKIIGILNRNPSLVSIEIICGNTEIHQQRISKLKMELSSKIYIYFDKCDDYDTLGIWVLVGGLDQEQSEPEQE